MIAELDDASYLCSGQILLIGNTKDEQKQASTFNLMQTRPVIIED
jgi:hypothetical protein